MGKATAVARHLFLTDAASGRRECSLPPGHNRAPAPRADLRRLVVVRDPEAVKLLVDTLQLDEDRVLADRHAVDRH